VKLDTTTKLLLGGAALVGVAAIGILVFGKKNKSGNALVCPLQKGCTITSKYGNRIHPVTGAQQLHNGDDFKAAVGDPITAPANGAIKSVYSNTAGGNQLILAHPNGFTSGYAHLSAYNAKVGQQVKRGQVIAYAGATGQVTGPHLHFTLRNAQGNLVDPAQYVKKAA